jgi:hypothetical protein
VCRVRARGRGRNKNSAGTICIPLPTKRHLYDLPVMGSFGLFELGGGFTTEIIRTQKWLPFVTSLV